LGNIHEFLFRSFFKIQSPFFHIFDKIFSDVKISSIRITVFHAYIATISNYFKPFFLIADSLIFLLKENFGKLKRMILGEEAVQATKALPSMAGEEGSRREEGGGRRTEEVRGGRREEARQEWNVEEEMPSDSEGCEGCRGVTKGD
jgi:hypothetical protein